MSEGHALRYIHVEGVKGFIVIYYLAQDSAIMICDCYETKKLFMFRY